MKNKKILFMFVILSIISIVVCFSFFENQDLEPDTVQNALSFGAFQDYEIASEILDEIKLENNTLIALYTTEANTIGIAYLDCSDLSEYVVLERCSMSTNGINNNGFSQEQFRKFKGQTVHYSFSSDDMKNNKKYTAKLSDNFDYTFYFSYYIE